MKENYWTLKSDVFYLKITVFILICTVVVVNFRLHNALECINLMSKNISLISDNIDVLAEYGSVAANAIRETFNHLG